MRRQQAAQRVKACRGRHAGACGCNAAAGKSLTLLVEAGCWTDLRISAQRHTTYVYSFHPNKVLASLAVTRALPGASATTTLGYDPLGNLISATNPLGHQVTWSSHSGHGLPGRMSDGNGFATDYVYNRKANLITAVQCLPGGTRLTSFTYNNSHQITEVTYTTGRIGRFRYNTAGRLEYTGNALNDFVRYGFEVPTNTSTTSSSRNVPSLTGSTPAATAAGQFSATRRLDNLRRPGTSWATTASRPATPATTTAISRRVVTPPAAPPPMSMTRRTA